MEPAIQWDTSIISFDLSFSKDSVFDFMIFNALSPMFNDKKKVNNTKHKQSKQAQYDSDINSNSDSETGPKIYECCTGCGKDKLDKKTEWIECSQCRGWCF
jgi:hypothetical protein